MPEAFETARELYKAELRAQLNPENGKRIGFDTDWGSPERTRLILQMADDRSLWIDRGSAEKLGPFSDTEYARGARAGVAEFLSENGQLANARQALLYRASLNGVQWEQRLTEQPSQAAIIDAYHAARMEELNDSLKAIHNIDPRFDTIIETEQMRRAIHTQIETQRHIATYTPTEQQEQRQERSIGFTAS